MDSDEDHVDHVSEEKSGQVEARPVGLKMLEHLDMHLLIMLEGIGPFLIFLIRHFDWKISSVCKGIGLFVCFDFLLSHRVPSYIYR